MMVSVKVGFLCRRTFLHLFRKHNGDDHTKYSVGFYFNYLSLCIVHCLTMDFYENRNT
jgi:hypothetical protein